MTKTVHKQVSAQSNLPDIAPLIVRSIVAILFGLSLYFSLPLFSTLSVIILPLVCGVFAWLAVKDPYFGAVVGSLISVIGAMLISRSIATALPDLSFSAFLAVQIIFGAAPSLIFKVIKTGVNPSHIALGLFAVIVLNFALVTTSANQSIASTSAVEPQAEQYAFDGILFLKLSYLTKQESNFYKAYGSAFKQDKRFDNPPSVIGGWRMPTTFWLWSAIAPRGNYLVNYFLVFTIILMGCAYLIASKFAEPAYALLSSCFVGTYLLTGATSWSYTELEYWGLFLAVPAAALYLYNKRYWALPLALVAGLMREWIALILIAGLIDNLINRRWVESGVWASACALVGGAYLLNIHYIYEYMKQAHLPLSMTSTGIGGGGIGFILYTLQFGAQFFSGGLKLIYALFFIGIVSAIIRGIQKRSFYWVILMILPLTAFMFYGSGKEPGGPRGWDDYYNINFMVYVLIAVPFLVQPIIDASMFALKKFGIKTETAAAIDGLPPFDETWRKQETPLKQLSSKSETITRSEI